MSDSPSRALLEAIERSKKRVWWVCYRMTGSRSEADDLSQETYARAIEREGTLKSDERLEGWLLRITTTTCIDHLRRRKIERRMTELVDPIADATLEAGTPQTDPEARAILRDDVRFGVIVALQTLPPRQRAALILHDVCDCPLSEIAAVIDANENAAKAVLARARAALKDARRHPDLDVVADRRVVERFLQAIEARSIPAITALLDEDVWGVTDWGPYLSGSKKPVYGVRAVSRQWSNANEKQVLPIAPELRAINGELAILIKVPALDGALVASIHVETRRERIAALRVVRDPFRLSQI